MFHKVIVLLEYIYLYDIQIILVKILSHVAIVYLLCLMLSDACYSGIILLGVVLYTGKVTQGKSFMRFTNLVIFREILLQYFLLVSKSTLICGIAKLTPE